MGEKERHLHFNISTGFWLFIFLTVLLPVMRLLAAKVPFPGVSNLMNAAWGTN